MAHLIHEEDNGTGKGNSNRTRLLPFQQVELLLNANEALPGILAEGQEVDADEIDEALKDFAEATD